MKFKPLLAATLEVSDFDKLKFPLLASPKLDGIRAIVVNGEIVSRNLKPIRNAHIQTLLGQQSLNGLDGELIVGDPTDKLCYRNTNSGVMSGDGTPDFKFHVFDIVDAMLGFDPPRGFQERFNRLCDWVDRHMPEYNHLVKVVHHELIESVADLEAYEQARLEEGYEGVMLRGVGGLYKMGRSTSKEGILFKLKRFTDSEATIVGFQERMRNENEATKDALGRTERSTHRENLVGRGDLGAIEVDYQGVKFTIGTGFDDALRAEIWGNQEKFLGKIVKFKHFTIGGYDVPRFPVFLGFRDADDMEAA